MEDTHHDDGEWVYHERLSFWADSGYSEAVIERAIGMAANAFGGSYCFTVSGIVKRDVRELRFGPVRTDKGHEGEPTFANLPPFSPANEIEVIVRFVRKDPPKA